tara:strand:+ start:605 stop:1129 length:525 start_codon:yes stop_codon:yes gene_type:complete
MSYIILVTGGTKSGKSDFAEYLAKQEKSITYIALSKDYPDDIKWQKKVLDHKLRRPKNWKLIETENLIPLFKEDIGTLLIDSIGGFIVNLLEEDDKKWKEQLNELIRNLSSYKSKIIIVGEQTGWGLVSEYKIGNLYTERLGIILKEITKISKENWLTINGRAIKLDNIFFEVH